MSDARAFLDRARGDLIAADEAAPDEADRLHRRAMSNALVALVEMQGPLEVDENVFAAGRRERDLADKLALNLAAVLEPLRADTEASPVTIRAREALDAYRVMREREDW